MSFTSLNNDVITTSRHAKFPLRFRGKYLSFYAVLMLYAQENLGNNGHDRMVLQAPSNPPES
ncbi:hypothetical protein E2C01_012578 [Portunus trituberculatus]|uniref:Uncharacterized protein n=1 Tax=Portunus trituberculatus TaxID=210409 RepID=A0A5B7DEG7_PORTR|nr:hypothetical protein [Portunus trituberculatus]